MTKLNTYRDLLERLKKLNDEQLDSDLTVFDSVQKEYYEINMVISEEPEDDVLDKDHPVINLETAIGEKISIC